MRLLLLCALLIAPLCFAQPDIPETPAGRVFGAWLNAFNAGDEATMKAFDEKYQPRRPLAAMGNFRERTGGFTFVRIETSAPTELVALVREKSSDAIARIEFKVTADDPPQMLSATLNLIPPPAGLAPARLAEADALAAAAKRAEEAAAADQFSGVVLVAKNGKVLMEKALGRADREKNTPVAMDTQFRMGSMNKMFTAVAVLQLVEAGKLSLDDTVGKHLKDYPNRDIADKVTIRHLLSHTGGTGNIFGPEFEKHRLALKTHDDYLKLYGARAPETPPGTPFRYSNYGFVLLGLIIEKVSGMSYYDYVERNVFAPAGMTATASLPESQPVPQRAPGYLKKDGKWVPNTDTLPWRGTAAGGGYTTARDLLRFAEALTSGKLISKAMLAEATKDQSKDYGFGFGVAAAGQPPRFGHNGGAPGMNGDLRILPAQGYVLIALGNLDPPSASRLLDFIEARLPV